MINRQLKLIFLFLIASKAVHSFLICRQSNLKLSCFKCTVRDGSEFERSNPPIPLLATPETVTDINPQVKEGDNQRSEISNQMRDKLRRELQSQGADPNYSAGPVAGNPILILSGIIALLVLLGGKGFFF